MKPLSIFHYIVGNRKKSLTLILTITFCVAAAYYATLLAGSIFATLESKYVPDQHYSLLHSAHFQPIDKEIIEELRAFTDVIDVVPYDREYTLYTGILSGEGIPLIALRENDIRYLIKQLQLQIIAGRVPQAPNEIILDANLAKNKGVDIGDFIGNEVDELERINGKLEVVGLTTGEAMLGFRFLPEDTAILNRTMILLKKQNDEVQHYLEQLTDRGFDSYTLKRSQMYFENTKALIHTIISAIAILIAIVVSLTLANINYIHLHHRKQQFSIYFALGYSMRSMKQKIFMEQLFFIVVGTVAGVLLALGIASMLNIVLYEPRGQYLVLLYEKGIPFVLCIPLAVLIVNTITSNRFLTKLDPLETLEGRD